MTTTRIAPASVVLHELLDAELQFDPTFRKYYSNHLAMALVALDQMGASPDRLKSAFDAHARGESERRIDVDGLEERLAEVRTDGIAATVRRRVPELAVGPGSQLFHPMIRLAYALEASHPGQVAAALLDWETRLEVLPGPPPPTGGRRLPDVAAALSGHPEGTWDQTYDLEGTAARREMVDALGDVAVDSATLDDISSFALAVHITADEFVTLHMVTGSRALRVVSERVDDDTARVLAERAVVVMAVGYAIVGAPPLLDRAQLDGLRADALPGRDAIIERAVASSDPHVIKLANVALTEEQRADEPLYRLAAARAVGLATTQR